MLEYLSRRANIIIVLSESDEINQKRVVNLSKKLCLRNADKFENLLVYSGYSKRSFAKKIGVSDNTINKLIDTDHSPQPETAKKIADGLGLSVKDIFLLKPLNHLSKESESNG